MKTKNPACPKSLGLTHLHADLARHLMTFNANSRNVSSPVSLSQSHDPTVGNRVVRLNALTGKAEVGRAARSPASGHSSEWGAGSRRQTLS